jgi:hypothetical protein
MKSIGTRNSTIDYLYVVDPQQRRKESLEVVG